MSDGFRKISQILFSKEECTRLKPFEDASVWTDAEGVTRHLTCMNSYHLYNLRKYLEDHIDMPYLHKLKSDIPKVIENITSLLDSRNYSEEIFLEEDALHDKSERKNNYDEEYVMYDGLWILGSGINTDKKWWFKYGYAYPEE